MMLFTASLSRLAVLASALLVAGVAQAQTNLVKNGDFELNSSGTAQQVNGSMWFSSFNALAWANNPSYGERLVSPSYPGYNGESYGMGVWNDFDLTSPTGGNFLIANTDVSSGSWYQKPISQTITGLTVGQKYELSFYQASSAVYKPPGNVQQSTHWNVTLGDETYASPTMTTAYQSSTGWEKVTMTFTAGSTSELLTFLGAGTPGGTPIIIAALDGISLTAVPEASTFAMLLAGMVVIGGVATRRRPRAAA